MIAKICGKVIQKNQHSLFIDIQGICYEVFIPEVNLPRIDEKVNADGFIELHTYHYHQADPSRSIPVLIGFLNRIEREFFEEFIKVSGIGPKAALRALNQPISIIAQAIDESDSELLRSLPGIGTQRAKEIVAKLQGKVGKFALIQDRKPSVQPSLKEDFAQEALTILLQLQYKQPEAKQMIQKALERNPNIKDTEGLLNEVYRQEIKR